MKMKNTIMISFFVKYKLQKDDFNYFWRLQPIKVERHK